ncbi:MAG: serine/threonine protein kinase [Deltaproteobacteria bacterium]|nr:serine/threonine protein kinase [Deltaproteobacteria bacterium]
METGPIVKLGRYEVRDKIAAGGMATVYKAVQTGVGGFRSQVALKLLHPHLANEDSYRRMFHEEARIGALLEHRCLLKVLDFGDEEGIYFIVTEYFPSLSLEELVTKTRRVPLAEALFVLCEAAEGLEALHQARDIEGKKRLGLIHRDVSPQNVLVGTDGRVKLIDYGIVKRADPTEKTRAGIVKGKVRYMSPEQAAGGMVDIRSDLFSLGVVFLRCVTGEKPHGSGDTGELLASVRTGKDIARLLAAASLPAPVSALLDRMLSQDPAGRPSTAGEVAVEARKLLNDTAPGYEVHAFRAWLDKSKATRRPPRRKGKTEVVKEPEPSQAPRPLPAATGIHPRWVFMGLLALFLAALLAYLADLFFGRGG